jgi:hypothetical protein
MPLQQLTFLLNKHYWGEGELPLLEEFVRNLIFFNEDNFILVIMKQALCTVPATTCNHANTGAEYSS